MIDEERVKELCHMAIYDTHKERVDNQVSQYYMWDYISKELIKSVISGTIAFALMVVLWGMGDLERITELVNNLDFVNLSVELLLLYIAFLALYLFVTALVFSVRYVKGRKRLRKYGEHMTKVRKMYRRDERLKA